MRMSALLSCEVVLLCAFAARVARAEFRGDIGLLLEIATIHRANRERILTWRGKVLVTDEFKEESGNGQQQRSHVLFAHDRLQQARRWMWIWDEFSRTKEGTTERKDMGFFGGMVLDGAYFRLGPTMGSDSYHNIVIEPAGSCGFSPLSDEFDAMSFFAPESETLDARFEGLHAQAEALKEKANDGIISWVIGRDGDVVTVESDLAVPNFGHSLNRYRVDLARGANLRSYEHSNPEVEEAWRFEFTEQEGISVPKEVSIANVNKELKDTMTRKLDWVESSLNKASDDQEFALEQIGAAPGDRVHDTRSGAEYGFESVQAPVGASEVDTIKFRRMLFLAALPLLFVVVILLLRSRRARREAAK